MTRKLDRRYLLWTVALVALVCAGAITFLNIQHIRAMPKETRALLPMLQSLQAAGQAVKIVESQADDPEVAGALERRDVHVEYGRQVFPASQGVWINTAYPQANPGRYRHRMRAGLLRDDTSGTDLESLFLIEVHQNFRQHGDEARANVWMFPLQQQSDGASITDAVLEAQFVHDVRLSEARADPRWRAIFADSHTRIVRAIPALAGLLVSLAAFGSLLFHLWREQPWAVAATTLTFVLPIVSAAPFLTAFGWTPILAAVILGFIITVAIACAVEQRLVPTLRTRFRSRMAQQVVEALLIPGVALLVGTALVVSFASVSVIPWQGLGNAAPGEIFVESLIRPAVGLLLGGTGSWLLLALFHLILNWRNHSLDKPATDID